MSTRVGTLSPPFFSFNQPHSSNRTNQTMQLGLAASMRTRSPLQADPGVRQQGLTPT